MKASWLLALSLVLVSSAQAGVVGRTVPASPLTESRLTVLPAADQAPWRAYLARSQAAHRADVSVLAAEQGRGVAPPSADEGKQGTAAASMPLTREAGWYASAQARHIADVIVSFQTPSGGWGKNLDRSGAARVRGQPFTGEPSFVGTLDNDATITEMRFLARVIAQVPPSAGQAYRTSFSRGLAYLLASQYPNGGWPQVWPLQGGYHDAVTFNDGAMLGATRLLSQVAEGQGDFAFVSGKTRERAKVAWARALDCILTSQILIGGQPAGWSQQHDPVTLAPVGARNFEPAALASAESAQIFLYLMSLPDRSPRIARAVSGGATWLAASAIQDKAWTAIDPAIGRRLIDKPGASSIWARYYDVATGKPIYGDRDLTVHDDVNEISLERRNGYAWFNASGRPVAAAFRAWNDDLAGWRPGQQVRPSPRPKAELEHG
jgi:PelA/Pel-15E family pectate lyase